MIAATQASTGSSADPIAYTIQVSSVFKGQVPEQVVVTSAAHSVSCGVQLAGRVLVFANGPMTALRTTSCDAPPSLDRAELGTPRTPGPGTARAVPTASSSSRPWWGTPAAWLAGTGVLAIAAVIVWTRRRP